MTHLNKVTHIGDSTISSLIQDNLIEFFDWGLMNAGGFTNISINTLGHYGGSKDKLRLVDDPRYNSGQVWEGFRSNWVWQSGMSCDTQPKTLTKLKTDSTTYPNSLHTPGISGVYINGNFQPASGVGEYKHHIDYPNGRVIFDTAISSDSTVTAEYSYKWAKVTRADGDFFREIQYRSERADGDFTLTGSGDWSQLAETRLQLPAIGIEVVRGRKFDPYALGSLKHYVGTDVLFHVLADDDYERDKLLDVISFQEEKVLPLFDSDRIARSGVLPLDYRGMVNTTDRAGNTISPKMYPELVKASGDGGYKYGLVEGGSIKFKDARVQFSDAISPNLYHGVVRVNTEVIM